MNYFDFVSVFACSSRTWYCYHAPRSKKTPLPQCYACFPTEFSWLKLIMQDPRVGLSVSIKLGIVHDMCISFDDFWSTNAHMKVLDTVLTFIYSSQISCDYSEVPLAWSSSTESIEDPPETIWMAVNFWIWESHSSRCRTAVNSGSSFAFLQDIICQSHSGGMWAMLLWLYHGWCMLILSNSLPL